MPKSNANKGLPFWTGAALATLVFFSVADASAFCRTSACLDATGAVFTGARCEPAQATDCGKVLFWSSPCVSFSMQEDASAKTSLDVATKVVKDAFLRWEQADCGAGKHPHISVKNLGPIVCDKHVYNKKVGNANGIMFHDDVWPHEGAGSVLALTTVTYNVDTGEIYDADMELNSANVNFTTGDTGVEFDLPSVLTHEAGHFLGLSHAPDPLTTMFADYQLMNVELRTLEADDIAGICDVYPPGDPIPSTCDPSPRRGLVSECTPAAAEPDSGCCTIAPGKTSSSGTTAAIAIVLAFALARARRAPRKRRL